MPEGRSYNTYFVTVIDYAWDYESPRAHSHSPLPIPLPYHAPRPHRTASPHHLTPPPPRRRMTHVSPSPGHPPGHLSRCARHFSLSPRCRSPVADRPVSLLLVGYVPGPSLSAGHTPRRRLSPDYSRSRSTASPELSVDEPPCFSKYAANLFVVVIVANTSCYVDSTLI